MYYEVLDGDFDTGSKREIQMSACGIGKEDHSLERLEGLTTTVCEGFVGKKDFVARFTE